MRTRPSSTLVSALVMAGLALSIPLGACNNESEGQPCDQGSDDCQSPLVCNPANRCCPTTNPTTEICGASHPGAMGSNPPPSSSSGSDSGAGDTGASPAVEASAADGADGSSEASDSSGGSDGSDGSGGSDGADGSDGAPSTADGASE